MDFRDRKPDGIILTGYTFFMKKGMAFIFLKSSGEDCELF